MVKLCDKVKKSLMNVAMIFQQGNLFEAYVNHSQWLMV